MEINKFITDDLEKRAVIELESDKYIKIFTPALSFIGRQNIDLEIALNDRNYSLFRNIYIREDCLSFYNTGRRRRGDDGRPGPIWREAECFILTLLIRTQQMTPSS